MCRFEPVDRPFRFETIGFWPETLERWHSEGLPDDVEVFLRDLREEIRASFRESVESCRAAPADEEGRPGSRTQRHQSVSSPSKS
jgi:hypothetical protein